MSEISQSNDLNEPNCCAPKDESQAEKCVYVLDSYGLIYRAYFAFITRPLVNDQGMNVSAIFGFFRNFYNMLKSNKPKYVVATFDSRTPTFRHEHYEEYNATPHKTPDAFHTQITIC